MLGDAVVDGLIVPDRDIREGRRRDAVGERHLRRAVRVRHADIADELVAVAAGCSPGSRSRERIALVAHVIGIDA